MENIENLIGYTFVDKELLQRALTHPSYSHIHGVESYQRLEFLGDSIVDFIIADELCKVYPNLDEGKLTKMRGAIVSATPLASVVKEKGYDEYLKMGFGELSDNIRSDLFEAICGAIYLDGGIEKAREFIVKNLRGLIFTAKDNCKKDFKSALLEKYAKHNIEFKDNGKKGEEHHPIFTVELYIDGNLVATADGENKKSAQQKCAQIALES
ncbi:MAG: ribonuclease III [Clostridia bacterium]|nr:ribonuclease III [Clostridia bacterium]